MKHLSIITRVVALVLALALIGAACGGTTDDDVAGDATEVEAGASPTETEESPTEDVTDTGLDSPAAELQQVLTYQLDGHEYLAGYAVAMGVMKGLDSAEFKAAAEALDTNSVDLADSVGSIYGDEARDQFLELWRKHIGFFVNYTKGQATGDQKLVKQAKKDLDGYRSDFGAFIDGATNGQLPKDAVEDALKVHVQSTFAAIDAVTGVKDGNPFLLLKEAQYHLPMIATALTQGIASSQDIEGDPQAPAVQLQQTLTYQLDAHEYLAGAAVAMGVMNGLDSAEFKAAAEALDTNSVDLADSIGSVYGDEARNQFLELWRKHIGFFVNYTKGQATGDQKLVKQAKKDLDGYREDFGAFIDSATGGALPKEAVADALKIHVQSTFDAIDAVAGVKDGNPFLLVKEAAYHLPMIATALSQGIVAANPDKF